MDAEEALIDDLPEDIKDEAARQITGYSVGLIGLKSSNSGEDGDLVGSGTLIQAGDTQGILTAGHVVSRARFKNSTQLGLTLFEHKHRFAFDMRRIQVLKMLETEEQSKGPDLAVIIPPPSEMGWVKATKNLWNVSAWRDRVLSDPLDPKYSVWVFFGCPGSSPWMIESINGADKCIELSSLSGSSSVENAWDEGEYDYVDVSVLYDETPGIPDSFGGVSGGGLWQMRILKSADGKLQIKEIFLSGVAFYQTDVCDKRRNIRCHGPRSVYEVVYSVLLDPLNPPNGWVRVKVG